MNYSHIKVSNTINDIIQFLHTKHPILYDQSWKEYLYLIYGYTINENNRKDDDLSHNLLHHINKYDIDFYYKNSRYYIHALDWLGNKNHLVMPAYHEYSRNIILRRRFVSNTWVEVMRFPTGKTHDEGYSSGEYRKGRISNYTRVVPYGCWFYQSKGMYAYIDVYREVD
jgi:hypothetical protein